MYNIYICITLYYEKWPLPRFQIAIAPSSDHLEFWFFAGKPFGPSVIYCRRIKKIRFFLLGELDDQKKSIFWVFKTQNLCVNIRIFKFFFRSFFCLPKAYHLWKFQPPSSKFVKSQKSFRTLPIYPYYFSINFNIDVSN